MFCSKLRINKAFFSNFSANYRYGFMMPAKYIRKIGEEMWEGMKVCAKYARNEPLGPSKTSNEEEIMTNRWLAERSIET